MPEWPSDMIPLRPPRIRLVTLAENKPSTKNEI